MPETHNLTNQSSPLIDYNMYSSDSVLTDLMARYGATWATEQLAADFHDSFTRGVVALTTRLADAHRVYTIALGGGCFQNARLLTSVSREIRSAGLSVLTARRMPANDGGISFGQAAVAAARLASASERTTAGFASTFAEAHDYQRLARKRTNGA